MELQRVGFFRELHPSQDLPSIHDAVRPDGPPDEERIVAYLESGVCLAACGGVQRDVIDPPNGHVTSPDKVTDGVWLWPGELAYYVTHYHLDLPREFTDWMRRNAWQIPTLSASEGSRLFGQIFPKSAE